MSDELLWEQLLGAQGAFALSLLVNLLVGRLFLAERAEHIRTRERLNRAYADQSDWLKVQIDKS